MVAKQQDDYILHESTFVYINKKEVSRNENDPKLALIKVL